MHFSTQCDKMTDNNRTSRTTATCDLRHSLNDQIPVPEQKPWRTVLLDTFT
jgi:hypothetical protein